MVRFFAVADNSCLAIRSLIVFLTTFWSINVKSLSTLSFKEVSESCLNKFLCVFRLFSGDHSSDGRLENLVLRFNLSLLIS